MERLEEAGRQLAALLGAADIATTGRAARDEARHVPREAWRLGVEHQVQLARSPTPDCSPWTSPAPDGSPSC